MGVLTRRLGLKRSGKLTRKTPLSGGSTGARPALSRSTPLRTANPERQAKRKAAYAAHLKSPHLREMRPTIWARARGTCQQCHQKADPKRWHLAHRTYARFGLELAEDLEVNCPHCNQLERNQRRWYE